MEIQQYFNQKKELYNQVILFLDNSESEDISDLINIIEVQKIEEKKEELEHLINLLVNISNNRHRCLDFFQKLEKILQLIKQGIQKHFSNNEIYKLFKSNKRLLLFAIKEGIVTIDESISKQIEIKQEKNGTNYSEYFKPEIKKEENSEVLIQLDFDKKRLEGENDSYICSLIRQDSVEEFVAYVNQTNISLSSKIKPSIFETNSFLNSNETTFIEYSIFFGSIKIFQYLLNNKVELSKSTWIYAIHSNNAEIVNFFVENQIDLNDKSYEEVFKESIKCHHNDIANYIENNLLQKNESEKENDLSFEERIIEISFQYSNYSYFPNNFDQRIVFYCLCQFNYFDIVNFLLEQKKEYIESKIINKTIIFKQNSTSKKFNSISRKTLF